MTISRLLEFIRYIKNGNLGGWDAAKLAFFRDFMPDVTVRPKIIGKAIAIRTHGSSDYDVFQQVCVNREYDFLAGRDPQVIVDAGANIGVSTAFFAAKYSTSIIVAIEPEERNFALLERNTRHFSNIALYKSALYSKNCEMMVRTPGRSWSSQVFESAEGGIASVTIGDLKSDLGVDRIDLLKIDIEGAERALFQQGYESWLADIGVIVIELHDEIAPGASRSFFTAISSLSSFKFMMSGESVVIVQDRSLLTLQ